MKLRYLAVAAMAAVPRLAMAGMAPDEVSGSWLAMHHSLDDGIHTDLCVASTMSKTMFAIRADKDTIELRISNDDWNLPANTKGSVVVEAGGYKQEFTSGSYNSETLFAPIGRQDAIILIAALSSAPNAHITFGGKTTLPIPLDGSTKALVRFQNCVRQNGLNDLGDPAGKPNSPF
ncbi:MULTISPECIES: hypothetical protein [Asaia]|uniref:hypothetical protein n=1 Tax=Asaia TaxID=91914 RepID=UPI002FC30F0F